MKLVDLIKKYDFEEILPVLISEYPDDPSGNRAGYAKAYSELRSLEPVLSDAKIIIKMIKEKDPFDNEEYEYADIFQDGGGEASSIKFSPWREWLGMDVEFGALSEQMAVAHCLWDMTFWGYSDATVQETVRAILEDE